MEQLAGGLSAQTQPKYRIVHSTAKAEECKDILVPTKLPKKQAKHEQTLFMECVWIRARTGI